MQAFFDLFSDECENNFLAIKNPLNALGESRGDFCFNKKSSGNKSELKKQ